MLRKIIHLILFVSVPCFATLQFETKNIYTLAENHETPGKSKAVYNNLESFLTYSHNIGSDFEINIKHQFDGTILETITPKDILPTVNYTGIELEYQKIGILNFGYSNDYFGYQRTISPPYIVSTKKIYPIMMNVINTHWNGEINKVNVDFINKVNIDFDATYFLLDYKLKPKNPLTDTVGTINERDGDMWGMGKVTCFFEKGFFASLQTILKNDLNNYSKGAYHIDDHNISFGGIHLLKRKKYLINWNIAERFRKSRVMYLKEYKEGFVTEFNTRTIWKLKARKYLKLTTRAEFGGRMYKHYMDVSYRRAWRKLSAVDVGAWHTFGGLFPRYGIYLNDVIFYKKNLKISPRVKFYAKPSQYNSAYIIYYRTDMNIEAGYKITKGYEMFAGTSFEHFVNLDPFTSGVGFYMGIRKW